MSFLSELKKKKQELKVTETIVTTVDGKRFVESEKGPVKILKKSCGFVIDTKPDDVPILIKDYVYIGSQDCAVDNVLEKYNIRHVLSLGVNADCKVNKKFVQILDLPETDLRSVFKECLLFIRKAVELKENVLVHCNAGVSRTSAVAIAYLMHYYNMGFDESYDFVKQKRPAIQPNQGFRNQLRFLKPGHVIN